MERVEKLVIDDGLIRLDINGNGILKFNPSDFNLYNRFMSFRKELLELEQKYHLEVEAATPEAESDDRTIELIGKELEIARAIDLEVKHKLDAVFGLGADFDRFLDGVNCMAFGGNNRRIIDNLLDGLTPYLKQGAEKHINDTAAAAKLNREHRRAMQKQE